jgi:hypothetical protein
MTQVQEDFNYPNHDPDRNRLFYLIHMTTVTSES